MNQQILEYDLYLDESGRFAEGSSDQSERTLSKGQSGASQLVALLVPRNNGNEGAAEIIERANSRARFRPGTVIHAQDIIENSYPDYLKVADEIIRGLPRQPNWQLIRLV